MAYTTVPNQNDTRCPNCNSDALYKYGKSKAGKQRFLCLMCKRQFTLGAQRLPMKNKPTCPECGALMHLYKRETAHIRFRCSEYPTCRTFIKIAIKMEN
jgi:transposase-like protein